MNKPAAKNILVDRLNTLLSQAKGQGLSLETILKILSKKGQAALLILFSLPFCQPIQIPGFSTPFGLALAFIGLRIAFGRRAWLPQFLLKKEIPYKILEKVTLITIKVTTKIQAFIRSRLTWLIQTKSLLILHGITISILSLILALPLPIPLTNVLAAYPILFFGLGILEEDGLMIIIAYILTCVCLATCVAYFWFGTMGISFLFDKMGYLSLI